MGAIQLPGEQVDYDPATRLDTHFPFFKLEIVDGAGVRVYERGVLCRTDYPEFKGPETDFVFFMIADDEDPEGARVVSFTLPVPGSRQSELDGPDALRGVRTLPVMKGRRDALFGVLARVSRPGV